MPRLNPIIVVALLLLAARLHAQEESTPGAIRYRLEWDNPASQLYTVRTTVPADGVPIMFSLPAWRPGRYIVQNYAANVQKVRAQDESGNPLPAEWVDIDTWVVEPGDAAEVTLAYEYYAHTWDAGSSTLRPDLAYFNPVNLFPWVEGKREWSVELTLDIPDDWRVATQLRAGEDPHTFLAPDYDFFADSPTIASPDLTIWEFSLEDVPYHVVFSGDLDLGERTREQVLADLEAIARDQTVMFGGAPFEEYWHLYQLVPFPFGHAVEHLNSTSYVLSEGILQSERGYRAFLGVTAHELFHAWNVKRIRPAALWPYDLSTPQFTRLHWVTEGVTSYYDNLTLVRTDLITPEQYFEALSNNIHSLESSPGRKVTSASLSSLTSWHSGYGDGNPYRSVSFYTQGAVLGLLLDLEIRRATGGEKSLDDVMRLLYQEYYLQDRGYPEDGFQSAVERIAGRDMSSFFDRHVHGTEIPPYGDLLGIVGLELSRVENPGLPAALLGIALASDGDRVKVQNVRPDTPALQAGLMIDDILLSIGDQQISSPALTPILGDYRPGDQVPIRFERFGQEHEVVVTLGSGGNLRWSVTAVENPTPEQIRMRNAWLAPSTGP